MVQCECQVGGQGSKGRLLPHPLCPNQSRTKQKLWCGSPMSLSSDLRRALQQLTVTPVLNLCSSSVWRKIKDTK